MILYVCDDPNGKSVYIVNILLVRHTFAFLGFVKFLNFSNKLFLNHLNLFVKFSSVSIIFSHIGNSEMWQSVYFRLYMCR